MTANKNEEHAGRDIHTPFWQIGKRALALVAALAVLAPGAMATESEDTQREFASVEAAVQGAFKHARTHEQPPGQDVLLAGAIVRSGDGYRFLEPHRAGSFHRPVIRLTIHPDHVATYIVHPRTGDVRTDRIHENVTRHERRMVDDIDPAHRPVFVSTPSGRTLAYRGGQVDPVPTFGAIVDEAGSRYAEISQR